MHVSNNWQITPQKVSSEFFTKDQQELIEALYFGLYNRDWKDRIRKQLADDAGGYGVAQSIAMFGSPEAGPFEFVMTGRHLTIRCDGNASEHVAFGGPIFYGHAAQGFNEKADHPGNVYWHQGLKANALFQMLDGKQRKEALIAEAPKENKVQFRGRDRIAGLPASELSADQRSHLRGVLDGADRALSHLRSRRNPPLPQGAGRTRCLPHRILSVGRYRERPGLGHLATRRTVVRLALPRQPARARVGERRRQSVRENHDSWLNPDCRRVLLRVCCDPFAGLHSQN